jgi:hypothetical protein
VTKNNRKKAVVQAISTAVALGWVIMQVESAQAATLTVNNLNDSGVGSLRDTINIASSNDVVEFLLGSNPSTITLTSGALPIAKNLTINGPGANLITISGNNQFPVFDISAADVTLSGVAIAGNINGYNSSNLTLINSTITGDSLVIDGGLTIIDHSNVTIPNDTTSAGNLSISTGTAGNLSVRGGSTTIVNSGQISSGGNVSVMGGSTTIVNSGQISSGGNISVAGGEITITPVTLIVTTRVPEPSAIAGSILVSSLALLAKKKQAAFRRAKV